MGQKYLISLSSLALSFHPYMAKQSQTQASIKINEVVEKILESEQIRRLEHLQLTSAILGDKNITEEERRQINRIFDYIQTGRIKIVYE